MKNEEEPFVVPYQFKYNEESILPYHLHNMADPDYLYKCYNGEVVKLEYLKIYSSTDPKERQELETLCRELFNTDFSLMEAAWAKWMHDEPPTLWMRVKMHLQWK